jgi:hypothetical protein
MRQEMLRADDIVRLFIVYYLIMEVETASEM